MTRPMRDIPWTWAFTLLLGAALLLAAWPLTLRAAEGTGAAEPIGLRFALVWRLKGEVQASAGGRQRVLKEGDLVYVGERVRAASQSEAVLKTDDGSLIAVRPGGEFSAEKFTARGERGDSMVMRIFTGSLRIITGWIGRLNRDNYQIITPTATIGVRGTDHEPYVLDSDVESADGTYRSGTYDKVNRGGTTLESAGKSVDIDPGKVGFVRAPAKQRPRALRTILLPVILDKVPGFYVPGSFDAELDALSAANGEASQKQLERRRKPAATPVEATPATTECAPLAVGRKWLAQLDGAIQRRDAPAVVALFATDARVRATVKDAAGTATTLDLSRQELADSTLAAIQGLSDYRQKRLSLRAGPVDATPPENGCGDIWLRSAVVEQGRQGGKPYRFESLESYRLQVRDGAWVAVSAETAPR